MSEVISPPVRVLDYGWQAPGTTDFARMGSSMVEPVTRAVENSNAAQNAFMLNQITGQREMTMADMNIQRAMQIAELNNQRARELAQWQHQSQMQREQMRDQRYLEQQKLRNESVLAAIKQKAAGTLLAQQADTLVNKYGGTLPDGDISDPGYAKKMGEAIAAQKQSNIQADAQRLASLRIQQAEREKAVSAFQQDPRLAELDKRASDQTVPGAEVAAQNAVEQRFGARLQQAVKDHPEQLAEIQAVYKSTFNAAHAQLQQNYIKSIGNTEMAPDLRAKAELNALYKVELEGINKQIAATGMMPGARGAVPKPWFSEASNLAEDTDFRKRTFPDYYKALESEQKPAAAGVHANPVNPSASPAPVGKAQPYTGQAYMAPGYDAQGNPINTAAIPALGDWMNQRAMSGVLTSHGLPDTSQMMTPQDLDTVSKLQQGGMSSINPIAYYARGVGSLFDSSTHPSNTYSEQQVPAMRFAPLPLPNPVQLPDGRIVNRTPGFNPPVANPVMVANPGATGTLVTLPQSGTGQPFIWPAGMTPPQYPVGFTTPQIPMAQPVQPVNPIDAIGKTPAGASLGPNTGAYDPSAFIPQNDAVINSASQPIYLPSQYNYNNGY
jgi:hypothetical protein